MMSKLVAVGLVLAAVAMLLGGCGSGNDQVVFQWVYERASWNPAATRLAFQSVSANAVRYIYSISSTGGNLTLLTPTDNDDDLTDEGGKQPAWSPDGTDLAIVARRGGTQALFLIDPTLGAGRRETKITSDAVEVPGADAQPSWKADSTQIVYVSTKNSPTGRWEIWTVNRDGTNPTLIARTNDANDAQWPVFSPDGLSIIYQSRIEGIGVDTSLRSLNIATGVTTPIGDTEGNNFREGAPSVVNTANGVMVAYSSNRNGDFDIWTMKLDGTGAVAVTDDSRSDGYPTWTATGDRIAFTRDNEVWTIAADGSNPRQITERYKNN